MAKQSGLLKRLQIAHSVENYARVRFAKQYMIDMACITLNVQYGFAEKRIGAFLDAMEKHLDEAADMTAEDIKSDKDMYFTREKIDAALKRAIGDRFRPWEERYKF